MATSYINFNGTLFPADQPVLDASNRAFRYGDGLFESLRVIRGRIPFAENHFERLCRGCNLLGIDIPDHFDRSFFRKEILRIAPQHQSYRVRFSVWRKGGGLYAPIDHGLDYLIETHVLQQDAYNWPERGLDMGLFEEVRLVPGPLSTLKSLNALPYVLAANYSVETGYDEVFVVNQAGRIAEAGSSNVFVWDGRVLYTPPLTEGCIEGVVRGVVLAHASDFDFEVVEQVVTVEQVVNAEAVLLTNSVAGVRWVGAFLDRRFEAGEAEVVGRKVMGWLGEG